MSPIGKKLIFGSAVKVRVRLSLQEMNERKRKNECKSMFT